MNSRLGIMQPYFFPHLGYFGLIKHADKFILLDEVQFIRHGWIERNRILKQDSGWLYIKAPLKRHSRETLIKHVEINNTEDWLSKILSQVQTYKKTAPYYDQVTEIIKQLKARQYDYITHFNCDALRLVCEYLGINNDIEIFSEMHLEIEQPKEPGEWALNICKSMSNVSEYWNPAGGREIFDRSKYSMANIELKFFTLEEYSYNQCRPVFEPNLSIIDTMMFNSPRDINRSLERYRIE